MMTTEIGLSTASALLSTSLTPSQAHQSIVDYARAKSGYTTPVSYTQPAGGSSVYSGSSGGTSQITTKSAADFKAATFSGVSAAPQSAIQTSANPFTSVAPQIALYEKGGVIQKAAVQAKAAAKEKDLVMRASNPMTNIGWGLSHPIEAGREITGGVISPLLGVPREEMRKAELENRKEYVKTMQKLGPVKGLMYQTAVGTLEWGLLTFPYGKAFGAIGSKVGAAVPATTSVAAKTMARNIGIGAGAGLVGGGVVGMTAIGTKEKKTAQDVYNFIDAASIAALGGGLFYKSYTYNPKPKPAKPIEIDIKEVSKKTQNIRVSKEQSQAQTRSTYLGTAGNRKFMGTSNSFSTTENPKNFGDKFTSYGTSTTKGVELKQLSIKDKIKNLFAKNPKQYNVQMLPQNNKVFAAQSKEINKLQTASSIMSAPASGKEALYGLDGKPIKSGILADLTRGTREGTAKIVNSMTKLRELYKGVPTKTIGASAGTKSAEFTTSNLIYTAPKGALGGGSSGSSGQVFKIFSPAPIEKTSFKSMIAGALGSPITAPKTDFGGLFFGSGASVLSNVPSKSQTKPTFNVNRGSGVTSTTQKIQRDSFFWRFVNPTKDTKQPLPESIFKPKEDTRKIQTPEEDQPPAQKQTEVPVQDQTYYYSYYYETPQQTIIEQVTETPAPDITIPDMPALPPIIPAGFIIPPSAGGSVGSGVKMRGRKRLSYKDELNYARKVIGEMLGN